MDGIKNQISEQLTRERTGVAAEEQYLVHGLRSVGVMRPLYSVKVPGSYHIRTPHLARNTTGNTGYHLLGSWGAIVAVLARQLGNVDI